MTEPTERDVILAASVVETTEGFWFQCPAVSGCYPFSSGPWPTPEIAMDRGSEHFDDHEGIRPTSSLDEFRAKHKLTSAADGIGVVVGAEEN